MFRHYFKGPSRRAPCSAAIRDSRLAPGDRLENEISLTTRLGLARPPEPGLRDAVGPGEAPDNAEFLKVRRLRSADGVPLAILTNHLPARLQISEPDLAEHGLYETLRRLGVNIKIAHQSIGARLLTEEEADLLEEETPAACLTMERTVYDDTGRFVEYGQHVYRSSLYKLQNSLVG